MLLSALLHDDIRGREDHVPRAPRLTPGSRRSTSFFTRLHAGETVLAGGPLLACRVELGASVVRRPFPLSACTCAPQACWCTTSGAGGNASRGPDLREVGSSAYSAETDNARAGCRSSARAFRRTIHFSAVATQLTIALPLIGTQ